MNSHRSNNSNSNSIDNLVYDFLLYSCDAILQERRAVIDPSTTEVFADNADYCRRTLSHWRRDLNKALAIDLYIFNPQANRHVLMERWKISYVRTTEEQKEMIPYLIIQRRILTLIRSLYCYVRLLPGFNLINLSRRIPNMSFQLYERSNGYPSSFDCADEQLSSYRFNRVSTTKGYIDISLEYIASEAAKDVLRCVNGGTTKMAIPKIATLNTQPIPSSSEDAIDTASADGFHTASAAIPIPSSHNADALKSSSDQALDGYNHAATIGNDITYGVALKGRQNTNPYDTTEPCLMPPLPSQYQRQQSRSLESYHQLPLPNNVTSSPGAAIGSIGGSSQHSASPPFMITEYHNNLQQRKQMYVGASKGNDRTSNSIEGVGESPPSQPPFVPQFSGSLLSTSPHAASAMKQLIDQRGNKIPSGRSAGARSLSGGAASLNTILGAYGSSAAVSYGSTGSGGSANSGGEGSTNNGYELKANIPLLPASPFATATSTKPSKQTNTSNKLLFGDRNDSLEIQSHDAKPRSSSVDAETLSIASANRLSDELDFSDDQGIGCTGFAPVTDASIEDDMPFAWKDMDFGLGASATDNYSNVIPSSSAAVHSTAASAAFEALSSRSCLGDNSHLSLPPQLMGLSSFKSNSNNGPVVMNLKSSIGFDNSTGTTDSATLCAQALSSELQNKIDQFKQMTIH